MLCSASELFKVAAEVSNAGLEELKKFSKRANRRLRQVSVERRRKTGAKPPQKAQAGWSLTRAVACERLFFLASPYRARVRSAHARPLLSKVASRHLLEVASTPPYSRRGL